MKVTCLVCKHIVSGQSAMALITQLNFILCPHCWDPEPDESLISNLEPVCLEHAMEMIQSILVENEEVTVNLEENSSDCLGGEA